MADKVIVVFIAEVGSDYKRLALFCKLIPVTFHMGYHAHGLSLTRKGNKLKDTKFPFYFSPEEVNDNPAEKGRPQREL